jgi:hypothetical protein
MKPTVNGPAGFPASGAAAAAEADPAGAGADGLLQESVESASAPEASKIERREAKESGREIVMRHLYRESRVSHFFRKGVETKIVWRARRVANCSAHSAR